MLFKILHGDKSKISLDVTPFHEGWCYVTHDGYFYVDLNVGTEEIPNNQRIKLNAKDAETLMGMSLDEIQSDWSVNDETSPAYIKNRPFYTTDPQEVELCNGTYDFSETSEAGLSLYRAKIDADSTYFVDEIGQDVRIIYDGTTYNLTSKYISAMGTYYVGNGSLFNDLGLAEEDTGEPFAYTLGLYFFTSETDAQHTIEIYINKVTDITIPHKYIGLNVWTGGGKDSVVANNDDNVASGYRAFAIGLSTTASGASSHAEGSETVASGDNSHAEGNDTTASNFNSHAEGCETVASGHSAHAEGVRTEAAGQGSHTEGQNTKTSAWNAHAEGQGTEAASKSQHVFGEYNIVDKSSGVAERGQYIQIAGNGESENAKSNAYTLDWSGNAWFAGDVKIGGTRQDDAEAKALATTEYVDSKAVQPDWSVSDEANPMYVKNRTHWSKMSQVEILPECQLEVTADGYFTIENEIETVVGHTYIVNWNGTPYTCVAGTVSNLTVIGNGGQLGLDDTGEPFFIVFYPADIALTVGCYVMITPLDGSVSCTISIIEQLEEIHKIDNKYLSDEVLAKSDWNAAEGELGHILNRTHYTEEVLEEIIPETTVTFGDATNPGYDTGTATGSAIQIYPERGEMFAIEWNGIKYYSEVRHYTKTDGSFGRGIGNTGMFGGAGYPQYPFLIGFLTEEEATATGCTYFVWVKDGSTTATFSVGKVGEAVHRLDAKYIPENVATTEYVDALIVSTKPKSTTVTLSAANWTGDANPYSQVVTINGTTENSKVDLQPTAVQIVALQQADIALMTENNAGTITVYAIGGKPTEDYTMQVLLTEVTPI